MINNKKNVKFLTLLLKSLGIIGFILQSSCTKKQPQSQTKPLLEKTENVMEQEKRLDEKWLVASSKTFHISWNIPELHSSNGSLAYFNKGSVTEYTNTTGMTSNKYIQGDYFVFPETGYYQISITANGLKNTGHQVAQFQMFNRVIELRSFQDTFRSVIYVYGKKGEITPKGNYLIACKGCNPTSSVSINSTAIEIISLGERPNKYIISAGYIDDAGSSSKNGAVGNLNFTLTPGSVNSSNKPLISGNEFEYPVSGVYSLRIAYFCEFTGSATGSGNIYLMNTDTEYKIPNVAISNFIFDNNRNPAVFYVNAGTKTQQKVIACMNCGTPATFLKVYRIVVDINLLESGVPSGAFPLTHEITPEGFIQAKKL